MYVRSNIPWRGSHLTIWFPGSKQALEISETVNCSWKAFSDEMIGAYVARGKWILGYGTCNSNKLDLKHA